MFFFFNLNTQLCEFHEASTHPAPIHQWEMPIPVYNTLMKLPPSLPRDLIYLYLAKAIELSTADSFDAAIG